MRLLLAAAIASALALASCTSTGTVTPQSVVDWLKTNCSGITAAVGDIAALITANPSLATNAAILGAMICGAIQAQQAASAANKTAATSGVVVVNGVPIHYQVP